MTPIYFFCPNCGTYLNYSGILPTNTNCPICQSAISLDPFGEPTLVRVGPPSSPQGTNTLGGVALGAILGAVLGGGAGALVGGVIGGVIGGMNEHRR